MSSVTRSTA